jgi:hypothetical protein
MNTKHIESLFVLMGARLRISTIPPQTNSWGGQVRLQNFAMDIQRDGRGAFFEFRIPVAFLG